MEKKPRREGLLERTANVFDLPVDVLAGLPKMELLGDRQLRIENHKGILAYGTEEIHVSAGAFVIKVSGTDLKLRAMTGLELLISGHILQLNLE